MANTLVATWYIDTDTRFRQTDDTLPCIKYFGHCIGYGGGGFGYHDDVATFDGIIGSIGVVDQTYIRIRYFIHRPFHTNVRWKATIIFIIINICIGLVLLFVKIAMKSNT